MRRFLIIAIMTMFTLSLFGGCLIRTNTGHRSHPSKVKCGKGYVKVKVGHKKWKCKKKKKKAKKRTRDHR